MPVDTAGKLVKCKLCGKKFLGENGLRVHCYYKHREEKE
jgi:hypothetical protein